MGSSCISAFHNRDCFSSCVWENLDNGQDDSAFIWFWQGDNTSSDINVHDNWSKQNSFSLIQSSSQPLPMKKKYILKKYWFSFPADDFLIIYY